MKHQPMSVLHSEGNALPDAPDFAHYLPFHLSDGRLHSAQKERSGDSQMLQLLPKNAWFERGDVSSDIRKFGHELLLDRHRFREISRLIHVTPAADGNVIRHQLQWHDFEDG